jgi:hypothetical protein
MKEIVLDGCLPALGSAQVDSEQLPANDGAVDSLEPSHKRFDKVVNLEPSFPFGSSTLDREAQDQESSGDRPAIPPHAHASAEGPAQFAGRFPLQAVVLAETGEDSLGSRVALFEQGDRFFNGVHGTSTLPLTLVACYAADPQDSEFLRKGG